MILNNNNKKKLISIFPKIELSYIKNIHKKVHSDIYLIIPKGKKFFAWFKCWNNQNICFILQVDTRTKSIYNISVYSCVFNHLLCSGKGTILYGTIFKDKCSIFNVEDIFYYKNKNINFCNLSNKLNYLEKLFTHDIKQIAYKKNDIIFSLPVMHRNFDSLLNIAHKINYDIYCIQIRKLHRNLPFLNYKINIQTKKYAVFEIRTCIEEDIYLLYFNNNGTIEKHNYAYIPDYKTSVFMNSLFRNVRENKNLDYIEESDDEDMFENINLDKFVYLDKKIKMKCLYVQKMKSWKPIEISQKNIDSKKIIYSIEKK